MHVYPFMTVAHIWLTAALTCPGAREFAHWGALFRTDSARRGIYRAKLYARQDYEHQGAKTWLMAPPNKSTRSDRPGRQDYGLKAARLWVLSHGRRWLLLLLLLLCWR
jgi:hypothetical protein